MRFLSKTKPSVFLTLLVVIHFPILSFGVPSCTGFGSTARCVEAGYRGPYSSPFIKQTKNRGLSWNNINPISTLPRIGGFWANNCAGTGVTTLCAAGGSYWDDSNSSMNSGAFIIYNDGGITWQMAYDMQGTSLPISAVKCVSESSHRFCLAVYDGSFLAKYENNRWSLNDSFLDEIYTLACNPNGSLCVAAGKVVEQTYDQGTTWKQPNTTEWPSNAFFTTSDCAGNLCVVAGSLLTYPMKKPLLAQTTDNGAHWNFVSIDNLPKIGKFTSVSCTGNSNVVCVAVGENDAKHPLMAMSQDNGKTWYLQNIDASLKIRRIYSINCQGSYDGTYDNVFCIAGAETTSLIPVILQKEAGLDTWEVKSIHGITYDQLKHVSCTQDGYCVASGQFLFAQSTDNRKSWKIVD